MTPKQIIQLVVGALAFLIWSIIALFNLTVPADYLKFIEGVDLGLIALVLREMQT